jgi:peptide/nickel transport system substrate-binding protein/oligopeptide transport system substrate-binding protein
MRLRREKDVAIFTPISPADRGLPAEEDWGRQVRSIRLSSLPARQAIEGFNRGDADVVLGGTFADYPLLDSLGVAGRYIRPDPVSGLFGLVVVNGDGFLSRPENREAVAMAIDRDKLSAAVGVDDWFITTRVVAPGAEGDSGTIGERWIGRTIDERRADAMARIGRWRNSTHTSPKLRIALPAGPGADALFARLSEDLGKIGIAVQRVDEGAASDLRLIDAVARFSRVTWYLDHLSCAALSGPCSESADGLTAQAREATDAAKRQDLLAQAEAELTRDNFYIPLGAPIRWSLMRGSLEGFVANRWAWHPLLPFAVNAD